MKDATSETIAFPGTEYGQWLLNSENNFAAVKQINEFMYAGIKPLLFHWTLIVGEIGDTVGYSDRWCYANRELAEKAFAEWDGDGEPTGWHRHPKSGRRRENGDASKETVNY